MLNNKSTLLQNMTQRCKKAIITIGIFSLFINLFMLTIPIYMLQIFDHVITSRSHESLLYLTLITFFILIVYGILEGSRARITHELSRWFENYISPIAISLSPDEVMQGNLMASHSLQDIAAIRGFVSSPYVNIIFDIPWTPIFIGVMFLLHPAIGILALIGAIIIFLLAYLNFVSTNYLMKISQSASIKSNYHINATLRNAETIIAMGMVPSIIKNWIKDNSELLDIKTLVAKRNGLILATSKTIRMILQVSILGLGAYLVISDIFTPGSMIASSILLARAMAPIEQSISAWRQMEVARESYGRLNDYLEKGAQRPELIELPKPKGQVSVEEISLKHPSLPKFILQNISFKLEQGETLVILGPSAAGKTTLARLLVGALKPSTGNVRLDGADVYAWPAESLGQYIGYMPQAVELFNGSIKSNIARLGEIDDEKVIAAAKMVGVHEIILQLPNGYETVLTDQLKDLSGGQRQYIALARAFYNNPSLIVLDEPSANLDEAGQRLFIQAIEKAKQAKITTIIITHNKNIVNQASKLLLLHQGRRVMFDNKETVLRNIVNKN